MITAAQRRAGLACLTLSAACAQVQPGQDFDDARALIEKSTGSLEIYDPYSEPLSGAELEAILSDGLTLDEALRVALLNNRELQADFQEIGMAHADWVQAQLLKNPSLSLLLLFPRGGGRTQLEANVGVQLLELWRVPNRTEAAKQGLNSKILQIARRAGERIAETRNAYYVAVATQALLEVTAERTELAARRLQAIQTLRKAGAAGALEENQARGPRLAAQLAQSTAALKAANAKRELAKYLSLEQLAEALQLSDSLPQSTLAELAPETLIEQAFQARLDLRALAAAIEAQQALVALEKKKAWGKISGGPALERASDGSAKLIGPSLNLSLPLFDQNQAQVARAEFKLEQLNKLHEAARIAITQDIRSAADRVNFTAKNLVFYAEQLLPQAQQSMRLAEQSLAAGQSTRLTLLEAQDQMLQARRSQITLQLNSATAVSNLERAVGAPINKPD